MRNNKKIIIIISIILTIALAMGCFAYMFIATDIFKSNKELFAKYFLQNQETLQKITDLQVSKIYKNLENENKYESNATINLLLSEGGEVSNPINNLSATLNVQRDNEAQYVYVNQQVLYEEESYLETEIIKQQDVYGIKIPDVAKKFVSFKNDENIETIANEIGIDIEQLKLLLNIIDGNAIEVVGENKELYNKYLNIMKTGIEAGTFEKQKNAVITYNNATIKTNAYSVSLNEEQVKNILVEIVNNIRTDMIELNENDVNNSKTREVSLEGMSTAMPTDDIADMGDEIISGINEELEIPSIKVTVYEQKQKTIRTAFEIGTYIITVENTEQNGETKVRISGFENQDELFDVEIDKTSIENQEEIKISSNLAEDEENKFTITLSNNIESMNDETIINTEISFAKDIARISLKVENKINTRDFEEINLSQKNNVLLNELEEKTRRNFISAFEKLISKRINEKMTLLSQKIMQINEIPSDDEMPQVEINKFNAKFEFYTGDEVSAENVKVLLNIIKDNIGGYQIVENTGGDENEETTNKIKNNVKIYIEKDKTNEEGMTKILEMIKNNKKYKVLITYKQLNGLIDYITITEI